MARTAAALIIGNELLTGKIQETNLRELAIALFELGISLERTIMCRDDVDTIVADLNALRTSHDVVFTTGGVGPTHDDVTHYAVARSFGRELYRCPELEDLIRSSLGERCTEGHLLMADIPEGSRLLRSREVRWPTVVVDNVFVLPGLPKVFRMKLPALRDFLRGDETPFLSRAIYTTCDEGELAQKLTAVAETHDGVAIGSYPVSDRKDYRVKLTIDGTDADSIERAVRDLVAAIPADKLVEPVDC
ncbi:MAG: molybdopterin-binding protein [Thermoanaerobaculia bacterium]|nr:molybdopterin-binding protein [Thermoanaerobaculia bacterium]